MRQLTEDYCSYEVANLLEGKGFPFESIDYPFVINKSGLIEEASFALGNAQMCDGTEILTCTHQMAMKWLREQRGLFISIDFVSYKKAFEDIECLADYQITYEFGVFEIYRQTTMKTDHAVYFDYKEAVEAALAFCLTELI